MEDKDKVGEATPDTEKNNTVTTGCLFILLVLVVWYFIGKYFEFLESL